ncbi:MAG: ROK family protein [Steroidobacteraceae bacterium]
MAVHAGIELGGTKCICILASGPGEVRARVQLPTADPPATLAGIAEILANWNSGATAFASIGIASFGPLDLRSGAGHFGRIGKTPKHAWTYTDLLRFFTQRFAVPVGITTDVIGAALAEGSWGAGRGLRDFAYVTVGTGVGVGLIHDGRPLVGAHHPELGHARAARAPGDDWAGHCSFHGACVEGLASGPAIRARCGVDAADVSLSDPVWRTVAHALGQLAHLLVVSAAPQRILMGGGVLAKRPELLAQVRSCLATSLNDYLEFAEIKDGFDSYIVPPGLGADAGPLGALAVAIDAHEQAMRQSNAGEHAR